MSVSAKAPSESSRGRFRCRDPPGEVGPADSESVSSSSPLAHEARRWTVSSRGIPGEVNALDSSSKLRYSGSGIGGKRKHEPNARADGSPPHAINMHPHVIPARMHTIGNVSGTNKRNGSSANTYSKRADVHRHALTVSSSRPSACLIR